MFDTLSPHSSWLGGGRLQINGYQLPDRDLSQARELDFVPVLDTGAVLRRRAGREVLYWRTSLGDALAAASR